MLTFILFILALPLILSLVVVAWSFLASGTLEETSWWRWQVLVAYDQLVNTFFRGWADESISSRAYRLSLSYPCDGCQWARKLIDKIFFFDYNHCEESYRSEKERLQMPPELRGNT
jgi:hypothetical protein